MAKSPIPLRGVLTLKTLITKERLIEAGREFTVAFISREAGLCFITSVREVMKKKNHVDPVNPV
jgi:hypothetical protein